MVSKQQTKRSPPSLLRLLPAKIQLSIPWTIWTRIASLLPLLFYPGFPVHVHCSCFYSTCCFCIYMGRTNEIFFILVSFRYRKQLFSYQLPQKRLIFHYHFRMKLGDIFPDFHATTDRGEIASFHEWIGQGKQANKFIDKKYLVGLFFSPIPLILHPFVLRNCPKPLFWLRNSARET